MCMFMYKGLSHRTDKFLTEHFQISNVAMLLKKEELRKQFHIQVYNLSLSLTHTYTQRDTYSLVEFFISHDSLDIYIYNVSYIHVTVLVTLVPLASLP